MAAGCGGEQAPPPAPEGPPPAAPGGPEEPAGPPPDQERPPADGAAPPPRGEDQPGGAGDEEPIRTEAVLNGRGGRLEPRVVRVPGFISVRLELRSADGASYRVRVDGRTVRASDEESGAVTLEGRPTGERYVVRAVQGARGSATVEFSAEPGP